MSKRDREMSTLLHMQDRAEREALSEVHEKQPKLTPQQRQAVAQSPDNEKRKLPRNKFRN